MRRHVINYTANSQVVTLMERTCVEELINLKSVSKVLRIVLGACSMHSKGGKVKRGPSKFQLLDIAIFFYLEVEAQRTR